MKTKLELIILLAGMMSCLSARAQIDIAVNGVQILSKMTKEKWLQNSASQMTINTRTLEITE